MTLSEMSFLKKIELDDLYTFLSCTLAVERSLIGTKTAYWERIASDTPLLIGVEVEWSERGYKTFLKWLQQRDLSGLNLLTIAMKAADRFLTDVAIGDIISLEEQTPVRYLVCRHKKGVYRATEYTNGDVFDLFIEPEPIPLIQLQHLAARTDAGGTG